jgi:hypothetical protein
VIVFRRGCDRIAALRLITIFRREADVDVLAGKMSPPTGHVE